MPNMEGGREKLTGSGSRTPEMEAERLSAEAMPSKSEVDEKVLLTEEAVESSKLPP